ncbi:uncharacterized protein THITE_2021402, partial [Thermothielavioides terrestris NRRL 8126]
PRSPAVSHAPVCSCCLAYQAVKSRERVRQALVLVQDHATTITERSSRARFESIITGLAEVCILFDDAERLLVRTSSSSFPVEGKRSASELVDIILAAAAKKLDWLNDAFQEARRDQ